MTRECKKRVAMTTKLSESHSMVCVYKMIPSPVGRLELVARGDGLAAILWENDDPKRVRLGNRWEHASHPVLLETERQLGEYFSGERTDFTVPLDLEGTAFQKKVWEALLTIPFGETRTYADIARQIGSPKAYRAMGAANGRNPVSIMIPCHRAIGSDGKLHGFAGGLDAKQYLLAMENSRLRAAA
jgi:methylated-DNA-[protein]-cysteine S-methyltransferase